MDLIKIGKHIAEKSADNLLQVTKDSKNRQKFLKRIIAALIIVTCIVLAAVSGYFIREYINESKSYIVALDPESPEMKTARTYRKIRDCLFDI